MTAAPAPTLPADPALLRATLLDWYDRIRRDLPWRAAPGEMADPYAVLVSEIMLQQTTVAAVTPRYGAFLARFPTVRALADAPLDDVLHAWQGLGYYRRARGLHAAATAMAARHQARVPDDLDALLALPGIGAYTARAVLAIAFGKPHLPVDANVERVLARLAAIERPLLQAKRDLAGLAELLAAPDRASDMAQAAMELGALVCTPARPACLACPWREPCRARALGLTEVLPVRVERAARPERYGTAFLLRRGDGAILFRRRPDEGLLGGMIELPSTVWADAPSADPAAAAPENIAWQARAGTVRHVFTHFGLTLALWEGVSAGGTAGLWCAEPDLGRLALPTLTRRLLRHAGITVAAAGATLPGTPPAPYS